MCRQDLDLLIIMEMIDMTEAMKSLPVMAFMDVEYGIQVFKEFRMMALQQMLCGSHRNTKEVSCGDIMRMLVRHMMYIIGQMVMDRPIDIFQK